LNSIFLNINTFLTLQEADSVGFRGHDRTGVRNELFGKKVSPNNRSFEICCRCVGL